MSLADYFPEPPKLSLPQLPTIFARSTQPQPTLPFQAAPAMEGHSPPENWTTVFMPFHGEFVPCYYSPASNPQCVVGLSSGMSSSPLDWAHEISRLNGENISVVAIGLHHTKNTKEYYPVNRALLKLFFLDRRSPLYQLDDKSLRRNAMLHSTACPLFLDNLTDQNCKKPDALTGASYLNPFFDTVNSSWKFHATYNALYTLFQLYNAHETIGTRPIELWYLKDTAPNDLPGVYGRPDNQRVRHTRRQIRFLNDEIWSGKRVIPNAISQKMFFSDRDECVCRLTGESIADTLGIEHEGFDATHFDLLDNPDALRAIVEFCNSNSYAPAIEKDLPVPTTALT